jgi:LSU ribosomal protein L30P
MSKANKTVTIKQVRSAIRRPENQSKILKGLGLTRMGRVRTLEDTAAVRGMINKIKHLVEIIDTK